MKMITAKPLQTVTQHFTVGTFRVSTFPTNQDTKSTEYKSRKQLKNFVKTEHTTLF